MDIKTITETYKKHTATPSLVSASLVPISDDLSDKYSLTSVWSQRNLERAETTKFIRNHLWGESKILTPFGPTVEISNEVLSSCTEDGRKRAVIRKVKSKKNDEDKFFLEIWTDGHRSENVDLISLNKHGKVWDDSIFGCLQWSKDCSKVLYIAEKKRPKPVSYFSEKPANSDDNEKTDLGGEYVYLEDWGELLVGRHQPVLCVYNCVLKQLTVIDDTIIPSNISSCQAIWGPDDKGVVFTGFFHENLRLGLIFCFNRRSGIFYVNLSDNTCELISTDQRSVRLPRLSPDGKKLVYFSNPIGGAHLQCCQLIMYEWEGKSTKIVVDISNQNKAALFETSSVFGNKNYHGLYVDSVPHHIWLSDSRTVILPSISEISKVCLGVDTETGEIGSILGPCCPLDICNDYIVIASYGFSVVDKLLIIHHTDLPQSHDIISDDIVKINQTFIKHTTDDPHDGGLNYYSMLLEPADRVQNLKSLILWPHGGPHVANVQQFNVFIAALCDLGFSSLLVNYRGSLGAGQDAVDYLKGRISSSDVNDCHNAVLYHMNKNDGCKWSKVFLCGGSHGGFLVTHLMAKYPDFYAACVSRNPVINLPTMYSSSDIPHWCFAEAGFENYVSGLPLTPELSENLYNISPIKHVHKVKTPTLFMLGTEDRRVPITQGKEYYNALKCNNIETKLLVYPENSHPLSKVDAEADIFVNMVRWLLKFIE